MAEKVTVMVLKVNLQCPCCYKKVKKILCKFPQIRNQVYDEKANTVTITVVCCNPEKIRDKLCCKGSKVIKSIEIKEPPKHKVPEKKKEKPPEKPAEKHKEPEEKKEEPETSKKPDPVSNPPPPEGSEPVPVRTCCGPCYEGYGGGPCYHGYGTREPHKKPDPVPNSPPPEQVIRGPGPAPVNGCPPAFPVRTCCGSCYEGYGGGPCYHGYGTPPPPQPCYDYNYEYRYGYGYGRVCRISRCDYYLSEENPHGCTIM